MPMQLLELLLLLLLLVGWLVGRSVTLSIQCGSIFKSECITVIHTIHNYYLSLHSAHTHHIRAFNHLGKPLSISILLTTYRIPLQAPRNTKHETTTTKIIHFVCQFDEISTFLQLGVVVLLVVGSLFFVRFEYFSIQRTLHTHSTHTFDIWI